MKPSVPFVRSAYNYDVKAASDEVALVCNDESLAIQSAKDECDINTIVRRFGLTGSMPSDFRSPMVGDFTGLRDFKSAADAVISARDEFMRMPASVRARFRNDPQELFAFVQDEANRAEAVSLGLIEPPPPEEVPIAVRVIPEEAKKPL